MSSRRLANFEFDVVQHVWPICIILNPAIQRVPCEVDAALVGFPCKSVSGQNCNQKSFRDETSTTGGGFKALMNFIDANMDTIQWVVTENVQANKRKAFNECPLEIQTEAFADRGFAGFSQIVDAKSFGLPQSRRRTWAIYVRRTLLRRGVRFCVSSLAVCFSCLTHPCAGAPTLL